MSGKLRNVKRKRKEQELGGGRKPCFKTPQIEGHDWAKHDMTKTEQTLLGTGLVSDIQIL